MTAEPQICTLCLGDSPSTVRMTRVPHGAQCRVCTLPFTLYHFKPSARAHTLVKTVLCPGCASQRDVCQCCMRDMQWHVSIAERDQIVALVQGDEVDTTTPAARNSMMKRFLARKGGKLGGAKVTGDAAALAELVQRMRGSIARIEGELQEESESKSKSNSDKLASVDISMVLARLPLSETLTADTHTRSFLLYNIPPALPEWRVGDAVARVAGAADWRDSGTDSLVVNHRAGAGGVRFASDALADAFVAGLLQGELRNGHGTLRIDQFRVHVAPWRGGFSAGSFGGSRDAQAKLCLSLRRFAAMGGAKGAKGSSGVDTKAAGRVGKRNKGRGSKGSKGRRATSLEL